MLFKCLLIICIARFAFCKSIRDGAEVMCSLPEARGHCRALLPRWRYDMVTGTCHEFNFGGCDGNGNNFLTFKACMTACSGIVTKEI